MPELPEVERGRKIAERVALNQRIIECEAADDRIVYPDDEPGEFERHLIGRSVQEVNRHGKHLWFRLDQGPHPLFHFGMTGAFCVPGEAPLQLSAGPRPEAETWPPRFTKVWLRFENGGELAMTNARRLGRIRLRAQPMAETPLRDLGFDPLLDMPNFARFSELVLGRNVVLKSLLLDQAFAAGIGNWLADEILYQASLSPLRRARELNPGEVRRLRDKMSRIVRKAVEVDADKSRFPRTWLYHRRWGRDETAQTVRGERIEHLRIAGRSTAWVPERQS